MEATKSFLSIAVVIPSYNSENTIGNCLTSLQKQSYNEKYQIIVVDSSVDATPKIIKKKFPQVNLIHLDSKTDPGTARNMGVKSCKANLILFIDSDCVAPSDWIEVMVNIHGENPECIAVGGAVDNGNSVESNIAWASYMAEFRENISQQPPGEIWHNPTCNISYKRRAFEQYGYFDSHFYPQEDLVFNYRLNNAGEKLLFEPSIAVKHYHRESYNLFMKHQKRLGIITAQVLKKLDLPGAFLARNKSIFILVGYALPIIKYFKTLAVFWKLQRNVITDHPLAVLILFAGMVNWYLGFATGVFQKPL